MTLPFYMHDAFGYEIGLVIVTVIGFLFGFVLERSGFGRARVLAAQFYFTDMRVLKVMFSAIVTAALGLAILGGFGVVELGAITVPSAHLWPMVVGGVLLGVGFVVCGYCPGTSVVATASGNLDGAIAIIGMVAGSLLFGWAFPLVEDFYNSSALNEILLPELFGLPLAVLAVGVVIMAIGAFLGGEKVEAIFARRNDSKPPPGSTAVRNRVFAGFGVAGVIALMTLAVNVDTTSAQPSKQLGNIDPVTLAQRLIQEPHRLALVDLRPPQSCAAKTIPGAMCLPTDGDPGEFFASLPATRTLILFGGDQLGQEAAAAARFPGQAAQLTGGYDAFQKQIFRAPVAPDNPTAESLAAYKLRGALHAHFTGAKIAVKPVTIKAVTVQREIKKGGGC